MALDILDEAILPIQRACGSPRVGDPRESSFWKYATKILETYLPLDEPGLLTRRGHNAKNCPRETSETSQDNYLLQATH